MKARGHRIVRYADDILILSGSRAGAENALRVAQSYLEDELKLTVNATKTHIAHSDDGVKFLGVVIHTKYTRIQQEGGETQANAQSTDEAKPGHRTRGHYT